MKQRNHENRPATGGCALLVSIGVLCLTVLSLLCLQTVLAEQQLSQAASQSVSSWYAADLQAQALFARLRRGELPDGVERQENEYRYCVPISNHQTLEVALKEEDGCWEILSWQAAAHPADGSISLPVWQEDQKPEGEH